MRYLKLTLIGAGLLSTLSLAAQELNESLSVEGEFSPTIVHRNKITTLPQSVEVDIPQSRLPFSERGEIVEQEPAITPLSATGWRASRELSRYKGYLDFGMGAYMNCVASAGYRFYESRQSYAGVWLQHNSTWGFSPEFELPGYDNSRHRSDSHIGLYGGHRFDDYGTLTAEATYHSGYFNYYGIRLSDEYNYGETTPTQTLNDIELSLRWDSDRKNTAALNYYAGIDFRHYGYRRMYEPTILNELGSTGKDLLPCLADYSGQKENHLSVCGGLDKGFENGTKFGFDADLDMLFYANAELSGYGADDYGLLKLTPYYRIERNNLYFNAGVEIDFAVNAGVKDNRYSAFHISPDIRMGWSERKFGMYINLEGGSELKTLSALSRYDYYLRPMLCDTRPIYSPFDGEIGFTFGQFAGFSGGFNFGYKITNNIPYMNRYMASFTEDVIFGQFNLRGMRIGVNLNYEYGKLFEIGADLSYQPQNGEKGYFNGYDRPRWVIDAEAVVNPWKKLKFSVGYQYRGVRHLYYLKNSGNMSDFREQSRDRLPDVNLLNIGVAYSFSGDRLTVWGEANNLFGTDTYIDPNAPDEGFNFMLGFGLNF